MSAAGAAAGAMQQAGPSPTGLKAPLACVVVNPSKHKYTRAVADLLSTRIRAAGFSGPIFLETTTAEPGTAQARLAVASGACLVVAVGGDGTVRSVAAGVAGTGVQMGIMPLGTANLAARNLDIPTADLQRAAQIAASARPRPCDLAWVSTDEPHEKSADSPDPTASAAWARPTLGREHACVVVAGIGFDAGLVASTSPALKARIGWGAYAMAAMSNLRSPRMDMVLSLNDPADPVAPAPDSGAPAPESAAPTSEGQLPSNTRHPRRVERMTARSLLIANGGRLPAGITLLPQARLDDGVLDIAAIDTVAGLVGWSSLAWQVLGPSPATYADPRRATGRVVLRQGNDVTVRLSSPAPVEVDGDLLAPTRGVHVRLEPGTLLIRCP